MDELYLSMYICISRLEMVRSRDRGRAREQKERKREE